MDIDRETQDHGRQICRQSPQSEPGWQSQPFRATTLRVQSPACAGNPQLGVPLADVRETRNRFRPILDAPTHDSRDNRGEPVPKPPHRKWNRLTSVVTAKEQPRRVSSGVPPDIEGGVSPPGLGLAFSRSSDSTASAKPPCVGRLPSRGAPPSSTQLSDLRGTLATNCFVLALLAFEIGAAIHASPTHRFLPPATLAVAAAWLGTPLIRIAAALFLAASLFVAGLEWRQIHDQPANSWPSLQTLAQ